MVFEPLPEAGTAAAPAFLDNLYIDIMAIIQLGILAVVILGLGLFVVRPIVLNAARGGALQALDAPRPAAVLPVLTGEIDDGGGFADGGSLSLGGDDDSGFSNLAALTSGADPVERLRKMIEDRQDETVDILRGWMEKDEKAA
jgi:flagellar M-ring protein FliF